MVKISTQAKDINYKKVSNIEQEALAIIKTKALKEDYIINQKKDNYYQFWQEVTFNPDVTPIYLEDLLKSIIELCQKPFSKNCQKISHCLGTYLTQLQILQIDGNSIEEFEKDGMNNQVKHLNTIVNAKRNERKNSVNGFSLLDYNPFVFDAIKNAHKFMKFEENEDDSGNYAQLLNQICYFSDANQVEVINEAGKPEIREYLIDFYEYFESVKNYNSEMNFIDTGEFFCIWFYLEKKLESDQVDLDHFCDEFVNKIVDVKSYVYVRPQLANKTIQIQLTLLDIIISYYPRFSTDNQKKLLDAVKGLSHILVKPLLDHIKQIHDKLKNETIIVMTEAIDLIRIKFPKIDIFEQHISKNDKLATKHIYMSEKVYFYCEKGFKKAKRLVEFNDKINKPTKISYHQQRLSYIYSLMNLYNKEMSYKPKDLKSALQTLSCTQVFEIYSNIQELQSSCLEMKGSEAADNFNKYIDNLMSELSKISYQKKIKVTHGHFQHNDKFNASDYFVQESSNEICLDTISQNINAKLIPVIDNLLEEEIKKKNSDSEDDFLGNAIRSDIVFSEHCEERFEESFFPIFEQCLESKSKGLEVNNQFKLLILGGDEELQIITHNLAILFEEQYKKLFELDIRIYLYPIKDCDLSTYIASKDYWYQKHVYLSESKNLYAPYIGTVKNHDKEMKKIHSNLKIDNTYETTQKDDEEFENPYYGLQDIMKSNSVQHYLKCASNVFQVYVYRLDCFEKKPNAEQGNVKSKPQATFYFTQSVIFGEKPLKRLIEKYNDITLAPPDYYEMIEEEKESDNKGQYCLNGKVIFKPYVYDLDISDKQKTFKNQFRHIGIYNVKPRNDPIWCKSDVNPSRWPLRFNTLKKQDMLVMNKVKDSMKHKSSEVINEFTRSFYSWDDALSIEVCFDNKQPFQVDGRNYFGYCYFKINPVRNDDSKQLFTLPICTFAPIAT